MINQTNTNGKLAIDVKDINELRQAAKQNSPDALKGAAKQFEALFMNMVMKSMRDATPQDGIFDSQESKTFTTMLDQQLSQNLAQRGIGLADVLTRQLSSSVNAPTSSLKPEQLNELLNPAKSIKSLTTPTSSIPTIPNSQIESTGVSKGNVHQPAHVRAFQTRLMEHANEASLTTGIPAKFMLGQAALESGWGKKEIMAADGTRSHNLFGIKATSAWKGKVVEAATTEYVNGVPQTKMQKFRAYDSYADAFRDYAKMLRNNPRYDNVIANAKDATSFAQGLQKAGYATDPNYANKLTNIIKRSLVT